MLKSESDKISIPEILIWKIYPPWSPFDILNEEYRKLTTEDIDWFKVGRIKLKGWEKAENCYILTGSWVESENLKGEMIAQNFSNKPLDFGTVIIAKNKKEAIEKLTKRIQNPLYPSYQKLFTLEPAPRRLKFKPRGQREELWKTEASAGPFCFMIV